MLGVRLQWDNKLALGEMILYHCFVLYVAAMLLSRPKHDNI